MPVEPVAPDRLLNPQEKKKFEELKRTFDEFADEQRLAFVKEFEADIRGNY
jgi:hypothetical protein